MWKVILSIMGIVFLAAGCNESTEVQQIAFRVQPSFSAAAALNENVTVSADQPFRISFEIAPTTTDSLHLQYRRNKGEWIDLDQADFPYPESASPRVSIVSPGTQQQVDNQWEWPLVIRRFADGAVTNNEGDVFAFRLITPDGIPVNSDATPELTLSVEDRPPRRHLRRNTRPHRPMASLQWRLVFHYGAVRNRQRPDDGQIQ